MILKLLQSSSFYSSLLNYVDIFLNFDELIGEQNSELL